MRSINAKKIAAVVTGAALLGAGLAFAGPVTFQSVPIISNSGQPVVQVVIGSKAMPSDGVAAANIAAAIGNLAYTSVPVTASVNAASASLLGVSVSSPKYSLSNQQVWLNESATVGGQTGSSYVFGALIGSILNQGVQLGSLQYTKTAQGSGSYAFPESSYTTNSPATSPFSPISTVPLSFTPSSSNDGGVSFSTGFSNGAYDNLLQVTSTQFTMLKNNYGGSAETEYLYLTGFPVYDQASGVNNFRLLDAGGAYQVIFNKQIANRTTSGSVQINVPITLLGQNYTIIAANGTTTASGYSTSQYVSGGNINLASSITPLQTVYVTSNGLTSGPWTVQLQDLGQPNSNGISPASIAVYYNGQLTNESSVQPNTLAKFNVSGKLLYLNVNQTFAGLYAYQKWAKMQLYTNVFKISNNQVFNSTTNPGWNVNIEWQNTTKSGSGNKANQLYSIIIYNRTPTNLAPGQSFSFITNPSTYKLTFLGETLGNGAFDSVSLLTQTVGGVQYANAGAAGTVGFSVTNITEPAQELVVSSQIPNAFQYAGQTGSTVTYDLTPYVLNEGANTISGSAVFGTNTVSNVILTYVDPTTINAGHSAWISPGNPLSVSIIGYTQSGKTYTQQNVNFQYNTTSTNTVTNTLTLATSLFNVTAIQVQGTRALPIFPAGSLSIAVQTSNVASGNSLTLATLASASAGPLYTQTGQNYMGFQSGTLTATYDQYNNQPITTWTLAQPATIGTGAGVAKTNYPAWTYNVVESAVPSNTAAVDTLGIELYNNTAGVGATPAFILNYSQNGSHNNVTYVSSTGTNLGNSQAGFRTERGSKVASISSTQDTFWIAKSVDNLQFSLGPATSNTATSKSFHTYGPYSIGQATNLANVSIANVNATIMLTSSNYTIRGISNLTATPSVTMATTPVLLTNLTSTPLVVLDSQANTGSNLILIGSGYVNTLSQTLQTTQNLNIAAGSAPIVQAYGNKILVAGYYANQTTQAANNFISQLYAAASTSS